MRSDAFSTMRLARNFSSSQASESRSTVRRRLRLPLFQPSHLAFYALMGVVMWLMLAASISYLELGRRHPFFLEKLPLPHPKWWLAALYVHVPTALFALPACLLLGIRQLRQRFPHVHRWLGRVTGALLLLAVVPS